MKPNLFSSLMLTTEWWFVCKADDVSKIGYVPASFLKKAPDDIRINNLDEVDKMLGFVSSVALPMDEIDPELKYIAIDTYQSADSSQLCFPEGAILVVVEKTEDGQFELAILQYRYNSC